MEELKEIFKSIDAMMVGCKIDYADLQKKHIDENFFDDYQNTRLVNSFLFNYAKIQDKMGAKLLKKVLYETKEIDSESIAMRDVLNLLEKLHILESTELWDKLREIINNLSHEYPFDIEERVENIYLAMDGFKLIKQIYNNLKQYVKNGDV